MSYETDQGAAAAQIQREADLAEYTRLENAIPTLVAQVQAWYDDGQTLATNSTSNPADTADLNAQRTDLLNRITAILNTPFA